MLTACDVLATELHKSVDVINKTILDHSRLQQITCLENVFICERILRRHTWTDDPEVLMTYEIHDMVRTCRVCIALSALWDT